MRVLRYLCIALLCMTVVAAGYYYSVLRNIPDMEIFRTPSRHAELLEKSYHLPTTPPYTIVPCAYEDMPEHLINAFLVAFHSDYFEESGHDVHYYYKAPTGYLIRRLVAEKVRAHPLLFRLNFFLTLKWVTFSLNKKEILCAYLNTIYFADGIYGINAASLRYFGKSVSELSIAESAALTAIYAYVPEEHGLPNIDRLKNSQAIILEFLFSRYGMISQSEYENALHEELHLQNYIPAIRQTLDID